MGRGQEARLGLLLFHILVHRVSNYFCWFCLCSPGFDLHCLFFISDTSVIFTCGRNLLLLTCLVLVKCGVFFFKVTFAGGHGEFRGTALEDLSPLYREELCSPDLALLGCHLWVSAPLKILQNSLCKGKLISETSGSILKIKSQLLHVNKDVVC